MEQADSAVIRGVLPVFQMPFHPDESIDFETLTSEIEWLFDQGSDGVVMAMVSEVLRLSFPERQAVASHVCRVAGDRGPVILSIGAESTTTALELACQAEEAGASALMAIPPVSIAVLESELLTYYERLLDAVSIPVIVQDASGYVGRSIEVSVLARILDQYGSRVLFKPEATPIGPRLSALRDATDGRARVFEGSGGIALVDSYRRGIVGTMPGADLIKGIVALWQALEAGDERRTYEISLPLSALVALQSGLDGFLTVEKYLLVKQGVFKNDMVRGPVGFALDDETRAEVDRLFDLLAAAVDGK
jgi:4-hydroxy-tetrahydrodipicolinate synthase